MTAESATPSSESVLEIEGLGKRYGSVQAVRDIAFSVARGEIVGLLGLNGAGKTTIINMVLGVLTPSEGTVRIAGFDIAEERAKALSRTNFAAVYAPLPGNLTVRQNLRIFGMMYGVEALEVRIGTLLERFDLVRFADVKCGVLSSGEQTRASLAKAMLNQPMLLLLDEPTASLDPSTAGTIRRDIRALADDERAGVLWTSHNMYEVEDMCDRVLFLSQGSVLLEGKPKELLAARGVETMEALFLSLSGANGAQGFDVTDGRM